MAAVVIKNDKDFISESTAEQRFEFFVSGTAGIRRVSPMSDMGDTLRDYFEYVKHQSRMEVFTGKLSERATRFIHDFYSDFAQMDLDYPLLRKVSYPRPLKFLQAEEKQKSPRNVIIFFVEGKSPINR